MGNQAITFQVDPVEGELVRSDIPATFPTDYSHLIAKCDKAQSIPPAILHSSKIFAVHGWDSLCFAAGHASTWCGIGLRLIKWYGIPIALLVFSFFTTGYAEFTSKKFPIKGCTANGTPIALWQCIKLLGVSSISVTFADTGSTRTAGIIMIAVLGIGGVYHLFKLTQFQARQVYLLYYGITVKNDHKARQIFASAALGLCMLAYGVVRISWHENANPACETFPNIGNVCPLADVADGRPQIWTWSISLCVLLAAWVKTTGMTTYGIISGDCVEMLTHVVTYARDKEGMLEQQQSMVSVDESTMLEALGWYCALPDVLRGLWGPGGPGAAAPLGLDLRWWAAVWTRQCLGTHPPVEAMRHAYWLQRQYDAGRRERPGWGAALAAPFLALAEAAACLASFLASLPRSARRALEGQRSGVQESASTTQELQESAPLYRAHPQYAEV